MDTQNLNTKDIAGAIVASLGTAVATRPATDDLAMAAGDGNTTSIEKSNATDALESMIAIVVLATLYALRTTNQKDVALMKGTTVVELGPQEIWDFPTWTFWGTTRCRCENIGAVSTTMGIQVGAGHEDVYLTPAGTDGSTERIDRQWAGFRLFVSNTSKNPQSRVRVSVW